MAEYEANDKSIDIETNVSSAAPKKKKDNVEVQCVDATESSLTLAWDSIEGEVLKWELEWRPSGLSLDKEGVDKTGDGGGGGGGGGKAEWTKLGSKGFKTAMPPKQKSGLSPGTSFDFRVRGRDSVDWYAWGPERTYSTLQEGTRRQDPVTLKEAEEGALTVAWQPVDKLETAPTDAINAAVTKDECSDEATVNAVSSDVITYELQIRDATSPHWTTVSAGLTGTVAKKKNLDPKASYHFRVKPIVNSKTDRWTYSLSNSVAFKPVCALAPVFRELFGPTLVNAQGSTKNVDTLAGCVVAIYFSASWCGPCRQFTPQLAQLYEACRSAGRKFEVVFVSADHDESSMKEYLTHMPWSAVPFSAMQRQQTQQKFQVNGIPSLKVMGPSGRLLDDNAVQSGKLTIPNIASWEKM